MGTKYERATGRQSSSAFLTTIRCIGNEAQAILIHRGFRFKLYPTEEQGQAIRQFAGVCRFVYNLALEQREKYWDTYRYIGLRLNYNQQSRELTTLRAEVPWIGAGSSTCQQNVLRDLETAFENFFAGRGGYPTPRRKGKNDSFRFQGREVQVRKLNRKWSAARLPKIGWVKFRDTRQIIGTVKNVTIALDATGWHVSFASEIETDTPINSGPAVGIDRGIVNTLSLSTGDRMSLPTAAIQDIDERHRKAQRLYCRRQRGSKRRAKAVQRASRLAAKKARIRNDWHHKATAGIANRFSMVVLEDLKIVNMTASAKGTLAQPGRQVRQKAGLNRSILNQGWYIFERFITYKVNAKGGQVLKVDPAYTSQTCSECGVIDRGNRKTQAHFCCQHCGHTAHADTNAAINILRRNTAFMRMEEGQLGSPVKCELEGGFDLPKIPALSGEDANKPPPWIEIFQPIFSDRHASPR